MKRNFTAIGMVTFLIFCFTIGDAIAGKKLLDDFSGTYMDPEKWQYREFVREVAGGQLVLKLGSESGRDVVRNVTSFQNPGAVNKIACTITVVDVKPDTGVDDNSFARIGGIFYNTQNAGGATGDIWADIRIGDRGSGLEAWWQIWKALNDDFSDEELVASDTLIAPGTLQTGTAYAVELEYTNAHDIIFRVAGQISTFPNAGRQRSPVIQQKHIGTGIDTDGGSGTGYVSALFDDVFINDQAQAYDRFSSGLINTAKWIQQEYVRQISNGKLRMNGRICNPAGNNQTQNVRIPSIPVNFDRRYIEAKMLIKSDTQVPAGQTGYARLAGNYYNDSRGPGSGQGYNGEEGNVFVSIRLRINPGNGQLEAVAGVWRSDDAQGINGQSLLWEVFPTTINYDTEYTLSIEFTGSKFIFRCNELAPIIYTVQTPTYDLPDEVWIGLRSRVFADPDQCGYIKATFDDVYIYAPGIGPGVNILLLGEP